MGELTTLRPDQLAMVKRDLCPDHSPAEFNLFMEMAIGLGLNPLKKQIHTVLYNKDDPKKRRAVNIVGIDGFRAIADRTGTYSPGEMSFEIDEELKDDNNPSGLISATVSVKKWHEKSASWMVHAYTAYWTEYAPLKENWSYNEQARAKRPDGTFYLDKSGQWAKMSKLMLA